MICEALIRGDGSLLRASTCLLHNCGGVPDCHIFESSPVSFGSPRVRYNTVRFEINDTRGGRMTLRRGMELHQCRFNHPCRDAMVRSHTREVFIAICSFQTKLKHVTCRAS